MTFASHQAIAQQPQAEAVTFADNDEGQTGIGWVLSGETESRLSLIPLKLLPNEDMSFSYDKGTSIFLDTCKALAKGQVRQRFYSMELLDSKLELLHERLSPGNSCDTWKMGSTFKAWALKGKSNDYLFFASWKAEEFIQVDRRTQVTFVVKLPPNYGRPSHMPSPDLISGTDIRDGMVITLTGNAISVFNLPLKQTNPLPDLSIPVLYYDLKMNALESKLGRLPRRYDWWLQSVDTADGKNFFVLESHELKDQTFEFRVRHIGPEVDRILTTEIKGGNQIFISETVDGKKYVRVHTEEVTDCQEKARRAGSRETCYKWSWEIP